MYPKLPARSLDHVGNLRCELLTSAEHGGYSLNATKGGSIYAHLNVTFRMLASSRPVPPPHLPFAVRGTKDIIGIACKQYVHYFS